MPKLRPNEKELQDRERRAVLEAGQAREAISDEAMAKSIGVVLRTFQRRKKEPGELSVQELRAITKTLHLTSTEVMTFVMGCRN